MKSAQNRWTWSLVLAVCTWIGAGVGCRKGSEELFDPVPKRAAPANAEPPKDDYQAPEEPYDEKGTGAPRLQMMWQPPGHERPELWSVALSGEDLRPVVKPELLYGGEATSVTRGPLRSPNGRYLAFSGETEKDAVVRVVLDRKARTVKTIKRSEGGIPEFDWTEDSKHLLFYDGGDRWDYAVETGALKKLPFIPCKRIRLLRGGKEFLSFRGDALERYSREGKLLKRRVLPADSWGIDAISPGGTRALFSGRLSTGEYGAIVIDADVPRRRVLELASYFAGTFGPDEDTIYYFYDGHLKRLDLREGKPVELGEYPGSGMTELTFVTR